MTPAIGFQQQGLKSKSMILIDVFKIIQFICKCFMNLTFFFSKLTNCFSLSSKDRQKYAQSNSTSDT